ncbi:ribose ABC transporter permease [Iocasia frigidifontis]|uniref:Ribose ABC transporter permease n=1 Tax=Iocasia fonsfrigidae TaxID=2682810 RepID=A0A8A7KFB7_9FIRM|nr:ribose ABC transporter permease [Iocasia fonsfrigidae]QTL98179.1 ribose ABC transporter permease [Iocasia fonsfrigidae]
MTEKETHNNENNLFYKINNSYYKPEIYAGIGLVLLAIFLSFASPYFLEARNLINLARQISLYAIIAAGMTFVILTGGIDLSVGSIVAVTGTFIAGFIKSGIPILPAILLGIGIGVLFGLFNGFIVANTRIPAIIVTLATMSIGRGTALLYSNGYPISGLADSFKTLGRGYLGPLPIPVYIMIIIFIFAYVILNKTRFGRHVYALGGNEETVRLSGINIRRLKMKVYIISGLMASISGLILASRLGSGQPLAGDGWELDAIAAVVVGGTDIAGGRGTIIGTLIGAFVIGVLNNGLNLLNVSAYLQLVVKGFVIIGAVFVRAGRVKYN